MGIHGDIDVLRELDGAHHIHPFTDQAALRAEGTRFVDSAKGCYLFDEAGRKILDGMAGLWNVNVGYGRQEIEEAIIEQLRKLSYYSTFFKSSHAQVIELSALLAEICPGDINRFVYCGSGSEGNDTVFRLARTYWDQVGKPSKKVFISRRYAYHGSTVAGASLGHTGLMHQHGGLPIPDIHHIMPPYHYLHGNGMSEEAFGDFAARQVALAIDSIGPDRVAAFIGEPIQGGGGVIIPPDNYWPQVAEICKERDVLLCADEVITGFGRTGKWFGCESFGFQPDFITMAKGISSGYLPVGAVGMRDHIADALYESGQAIWHGYTYASHPVCCAAAIATIKLMREERIVETAAETAVPHFRATWQTLADHPLVGEARSYGLLAGLEINVGAVAPNHELAKPDHGAAAVSDAAYREGLVVRPVRDVLVASPPLVIAKDEIDELVSKVRIALDGVLRTVRG